MQVVDIKELYLFPVYATREEYEMVTGKPCPPFDPNRPAQRWEDPNAKGMFTTYPFVLKPEVPEISALTIPSDWARVVNIPPSAGMAVGYTKGHINPPLVRGLLPDEEFRVSPFGFAIVKKSTEPEPVGFTPSDRRLLEAIALKLGAV